MDYYKTIGSIGQLETGMEGNKDANAALQTGLTNAADSLTKYYGNAATYQQPYSQAGQAGLSGAQNIANMAPSTSNFQFNYQQDPSYQNQLTAGNQNIQGQAASMGSLFSGSTMKALQQYGSNLANQSYNQNYNRALNTYTNQRDFDAQQLLNKYTQYMGLTNVGQAAANNLTGMQTSLGQQQAGINVAQGQANAGEVMGNANAKGNFFGQVFGSGGSSGGGGENKSGGGMDLNSLFSSIFKSGGSTGGGGDSIGSDSIDTGGSTSSDMGSSA
jgi:hypothetical protein